MSQGIINYLLEFTKIFMFELGKTKISCLKKQTFIYLRNWQTF